MINIWEDQEDYVEWENESDNEFREFGHGGNAKALVAQYKLVKNKEQFKGYVDIEVPLYLLNLLGFIRMLN